ncbi:MAG TPA: 50S ribosomal protein L4 [Gammaproteobacteria bacterium]|nr:50S ribosomal protein L4 [Gammaproteobacteria bacterium]
MELNLTTASGAASKKAVEVSDLVFGSAFNESLVHQAVTAYLAGGRAGTRAQKTRSQVRGGGAKPWRQKGTGRARAGTSRSPIWRGGGKAFAAVPANYAQKLNKKMYRAAMRSIFSELNRLERLVVVDKFVAETEKTREMVARLSALNLDDVAIVCVDPDDKLYLSVRNLPWAEVVDVEAIDPVTLLRHEKVLITVDAVKKLEERLG